MTASNRRKYPRILLDDLSEDDAVRSGDARVQNMSAGGCFIETREDLNVGDSYDFQWEVPETGLMISRDGEIAWKTTIGEGEEAIHGYGVRFSDTRRAAAAEVVSAVYNYRQHRDVPMFRIAKKPSWMAKRGAAVAPAD